MLADRRTNWLVFLRKLPSLFFGLFLFASGVVANLYSGLGMSPWGVLNVGLANILPLTLGQVSQLIGLVVIAIGWGLGFAPGFGTLANMYFIGLFIDLIIGWNLIPTPSSPVEQFLLLLASIAVLGVGSYFYLRVQLGAGPRDGLMVGFVKRLNRPVAHVRGAIEVSVLVVGYIFGGPVGIGTVLTALTVGYSVQLAFRIGRFDSKKAKQLNLLELFRCLGGDGQLP